MNGFQMVNSNGLLGLVALTLNVPDCKMSVQRPFAHQETHIMELRFILMWAALSTFLNGT